MAEQWHISFLKAGRGRPRTRSRGRPRYVTQASSPASLRHRLGAMLKLRCAAQQWICIRRLRQPNSMRMNKFKIENDATPLPCGPTDFSRREFLMKSGLLAAATRSEE